MHKNQKIILLIALFLAFILIAPSVAAEDTASKAPDIDWQKCFGGSSMDEASSIIQTSDGGYIVAGYSESNDGDVSGNHGVNDYWVVKLSSTGSIDWQKCLGGTKSDEAQSIIQTSDGGYIVAGYSESNDGDVSGNHGVNDYWVVKLSSTGSIDWQKCLGGSKSDYAYSIIQTSDGGYIVAGDTYSNDGDVTGNHGSRDCWVVKLSSSGSIDWQKCLGGNLDESAYSIIQTSDGGYIVAGYTLSNDGDVSGNHGLRDYWIVKLSSSGSIDWQKCLGGSELDIANSIIQTSDGGYIVIGLTLSNDGDVSGKHRSDDCWVVKLSSTGSIDWQKCLGGSDTDSASFIIQTSDGGYIVAGYTLSNDGDVTGNHGLRDYWIVKLSSSGSIDWQKCLGGNLDESAYSIIQTSDGGYIVAGKTNSNDGEVSGKHGVEDYWIVKLTHDSPSTPGFLFPSIAVVGIMAAGGGLLLHRKKQKKENKSKITSQPIEKTGNKKIEKVPDKKPLAPAKIIQTSTKPVDEKAAKTEVSIKKDEEKEEQDKLIQLKHKAAVLLKTAEEFGEVPGSVKTNLGSDNASDIEDAIKKLEIFIETEKEKQKLNAELKKLQGEANNLLISAEKFGPIPESIKVKKESDNIDEIKDSIKKINEFIEAAKEEQKQKDELNKLKEKGNNLLKSTEEFAIIPESIISGLKSNDISEIEDAIKQLEEFKEKAQPELQLSISTKEMVFNNWRREEVEIRNDGQAHAFDVSFEFSNDFETRRIKPQTIEAGETVKTEFGIKPIVEGNIPLEITITYKDVKQREYSRTDEYWINVVNKDSISRPQGPVSDITPKPTMPSQLPTEMAEKYTETSFLGKGGFARVFRAKRKDGKEVAVKIPISLDASTGKSFISEMQNWTKINHENIVRVYDYNIMPLPYFEMELCDGSLNELDKPIGSKEASWIIFNICEGLKYTHSQKIIHRDLKPHNILMKNGMPKISDWGLSKVLTESNSSTGTSFTPFYASPEQIGNKVKDERTDIWQVGVIFYELVTGKLPFTGDSLVEVGMAIATKDPVIPSEIVPDSKDIEPVIMKCLEKDPAKRYQSVSDLQKALADYLKVNYSESMKLSISANDLGRAAYLCGELLVVSLKTGDLLSADKYARDLLQYTSGELKTEVENLVEQISFRIDEGIDDVPEELVRLVERILDELRRQ